MRACIAQLISSELIPDKNVTKHNQINSIVGEHISGRKLNFLPNTTARKHNCKNTKTR